MSAHSCVGLLPKGGFIKPPAAPSEVSQAPGALHTEGQPQPFPLLPRPLPRASPRPFQADGSRGFWLHESGMCCTGGSDPDVRDNGRGAQCNLREANLHKRSPLPA